MKKVFVVGQAPPRTDQDRPFGRTALYQWLELAGISEEVIREAFSFGALIDYFPGSKGGSHMAPTPAQILEARPRLAAKLRHAAPDIVVPVGTLAIREALLDSKLLLSHAVGHSYEADPFGVLGRPVSIIPLPHPSGASPWTWLEGNKRLLDQALAVLAAELEK